MSLARAGTETEAANLALAHIGEPAIADLAQGGIRARTMRRNFAAARDAAQRAKWWNFCKAFDRPAADPVAALGHLKTRYALPADCLRVRYLDDGEGGIYHEDSGAWSIENGSAVIGGATLETSLLATNVSAPLVCFNRRIVTVSLWTPDFLMGFTLLLASMGARTLGRSVGKAAALKAESEEVFAGASAIDSKEESVRRIAPVPSFLTARRGLRRIT